VTLCIGDSNHAGDVVDELAQLSFGLALRCFCVLAIFDTVCSTHQRMIVPSASRTGRPWTWNQR